MRLVFACFYGILFASLIGTTQTSADPDLGPQVTEIRIWEHPSYTRLVLELTAEVKPRILLISNPYRIVLDLPRTEFLVSMAQQEQVGVVKSFRFGLFKPEVSRLVIDLARPAVVARNFILMPSDQKPYRLVLDFRPVSNEEFTVAAVKTRVTEPSTDKGIENSPLHHEENVNEKFTIVVDAGHGGVDPGAIGRNGFYEKTVALAAAKELKKALEKFGSYRVVLTRDTDIYLPLKQRVAIARQVAGDLFVSIHADSIKNQDIRGGHVYTLSEKASDKAAQALAEKENQSDVIAGFDLEEHPADVSSILVSLAQRETNNSSAKAANSIVDEWKTRGLTLLRKPHRQAGFAVLKAPDIPSVLVELGFLSNKEEAYMLSNASTRLPLIKALAQSLHNYIQTTETPQK